MDKPSNDNHTPSGDYSNLVENAIKKFRNDMGNVNVIIAGKTGVGKSTLINAIFHDNLAVTGTGKPVTQDIKEITKEGLPITIIDSKGLELKDYTKIITDLENYVMKRKDDPKVQNHIHVAWVCIAEGSARIEEGEEELIGMLLKYMPVIVVITKCYTINNGLENQAKEMFPDLNVIRVQSVPIKLEGGHEIQPKNLVELVNLTNSVITPLIQDAFIASQKVDLELKKDRAQKIIKIIKKDTKGITKNKELINNIVSMITSVSGVYGIELDKEFLNDMVKTIFGENDSRLKKLIKGFYKKNSKSTKSNKIEGEEAAELVGYLGELYLITIIKAFKNRNGEMPSDEEIKQLIIIILNKSSHKNEN